ncbi:MAG: M48 family metallopeptidase [Desulfobacterales bacterium]|nr:MAG: M48 family metallopeptidase [Desulfobacterales bacterium]
MTGRKSKTIEVPGLGTLLLERSPRARYVNISVKPFKGVRVAVPVGVSFRKALAVVQSKAPWVRKHLANMRKIEQDHQGLWQKACQIDRAQARGRLVQRLNELAERWGFTYNRVFVKNQKTRWGSCSAQNNINLNVNLAWLPDELVDYTILHELVHTRVKNHGPRFWDELEKMVGDPRKRHQRLKEYEALLI